MTCRSLGGPITKSFEAQEQSFLKSRHKRNDISNPLQDTCAFVTTAFNSLRVNAAVKPKHSKPIASRILPVQRQTLTSLPVRPSQSLLPIEFAYTVFSTHLASVSKPLNRHYKQSPTNTGLSN
jgi:hypothetical protein